MKNGQCQQHFTNNDILIAAVKRCMVSAVAFFPPYTIYVQHMDWWKFMANGGDYMKISFL